MKRLMMPVALCVLLLASSVAPAAAAGPSPVTINYPDLTFGTAYSAEVFPDRWNLTLCDLLVSYTLDVSNAPVPIAGDPRRAQVQVGLRDNATGFRGGLESFYDDNAAMTDLNDKLMLIVPNDYSEAGYDVDGRNGNVDVISEPPYGAGKATDGIWFDRATSLGIFNVSLKFHAVQAEATPTVAAFATVNGKQTAFFLGEWYPTPDPTNAIIPAGRSMTGTNFRNVRVQAAGVAGQGGPGSMQIRNMQTTGCAAPPQYPALYLPIKMR